MSEKPKTIAKVEAYKDSLGGLHLSRKSAVLAELLHILPETMQLGDVQWIVDHGGLISEILGQLAETPFSAKDQALQQLAKAKDQNQYIGLRRVVETKFEDGPLQAPRYPDEGYSGEGEV